MICPGCDRDNDSRRRYCGKCGHNFRPCCRRCSFANDGHDRFCGGCGANLIASDGVHLKKAAPPPPVHGDETETATTQAVPVIAPAPPPPPARRVRPPSVPKAVKVAPPPPRAPEPQPPSGDELAGLFTATVLPGGAPLPQTGVSQDDVDRLFGAAP